MLLCILLVSLIPIPIFQSNVIAEIGNPLTYHYEAIVTNPNGAKATSQNEETIIPFNAHLTVDYDFPKGQDRTITVIYNDTRWTIKAADITPTEAEIDSSSIKEQTPLSRYIIDDGLCLYKGPSESYGKTDDGYCLPAGIIITSAYYDQVWMYIEYDGHKGWVQHYNTFQQNPKTANLGNDQSFIILNNTIELKNTPYENGQTIASLNVDTFTRIPILYYFYINNSQSQNYISYGGYSGWYFIDAEKHNTATQPEGNEPTTGKTFKDVNLTNTPDAGSTSETIPANTVFDIIYITGYKQDRKFYIKAIIDQHAITGWINDTDFARPITKQTMHHTEDLSIDQPIYDAPRGTETGEKAPAGSYTILYYYNFDDTNEHWYYITKEETSNDLKNTQEIGWIKSLNTSEVVNEIYKDTMADFDDIISSYENAKNTGNSSQINRDNTKQVDNVFTTIIWSLIGFFYVGVIIIIVLIIIKRAGKKSKNNSSKNNTNTANEAKINNPNNFPTSNSSNMPKSTNKEAEITPKNSNSIIESDKN